MPMITDLEFDENEKATIRDIQTSDGTAAGTPTDISGWSLLFVVHSKLGDLAPVKSYMVGSGISIPTGTDGLSITSIPQPDIAAIGPGRHYYYLQRTDAGHEIDLSRGVFRINKV